MTSEQFLESLTGLSEQEKISELSSLFFTISEIALFLDFNEEEFRRQVLFEKDSWMSKAYYKGIMRTTIKMRFDTRRFALAGSPQAEEEMRQFLTRQKLEEDA
ncbi:MAG: hypothetical protein KBT67_03895 [bacterium]|nr:hypothetical protein [Candidatus Limimorpha caballi]